MELLLHSQSLYSAIKIRALQHVHAENDWTCADHRHPFTEFIHCVSGTIEQQIGQEIYLLHPGDSIVIKAGYFHNTRIIKDAVFLGFHFDLEDVYISKLFQTSTADCLIKANTTYGEAISQLIGTFIENNSHALKEHELPENSNETELSLANLETHSWILLVICKLARYLKVNQNEISYSKHSELYIAEAASKLLADNLLNSYSITDLANELNLHRTYVSTIFSKVYGISPKLFQQNLKLERAKDLLLETNQSIELIAESLNFSASSHFSKFFLVKTGVPPSQFRKRNFQQ